MKAFNTSHASLFFNTATSAGPLTNVWSAPFLSKARHTEIAGSRLAARRQLRHVEADANPWQETVARLALVLTILSAYATTIWQLGGF